MRGSVVPMIFIIVMVVILLFISISMLIPLQETFEKQSIDILSRLRPSIDYSFSTDDIIKSIENPADMLDPMDNYFMSKHSATPYKPDFCEDLKNCIKDSLIKNIKNCEIDIDVPQESQGVMRNLIYTCDDEQLYTEDSSGNRQQICKYAKPSAVQLIELNYFYDGRNSWEDCVNPHMPYIYGGYFPSGVDSFCSGRGSYSESGAHNIVSFIPYYMDYSAITPTNYNFADFRSGGRVKIFVYGVEVNNNIERTCKYDIMTAPQPAIAASRDDVTFEIFNLMYLMDDVMMKKPSDTPPAGSYVTLYKDVDWKGDYGTFASNTRYIGDKLNSEDDDGISSVKMQGDIYATLYDDVDYAEGNGYRNIYSDINDLGDDGFNDRASSLKIRGLGSMYMFGYYPRVYTHEFAEKEYKPTLDEITESLRAGFMEWSKLHYRDQYMIDQYDIGNMATYIIPNMSRWNVEWFNTNKPSQYRISYDSDCWNEQYFGYNSETIEYYKNGAVPSILYDPEETATMDGSKFKDYSKLKIVIAMYKKEIDTKIMDAATSNEQEVNAIELVPIITVCAKK